MFFYSKILKYTNMIPSICEKFCILLENEGRYGDFFVKN